MQKKLNMKLSILYKRQKMRANINIRSGRRRQNRFRRIVKEKEARERGNFSTPSVLPTHGHRGAQG